MAGMPAARDQSVFRPAAILWNHPEGAPRRPDLAQFGDLRTSNDSDLAAVLRSAIRECPGRDLLLLNSRCRFPQQLLPRLDRWRRQARAMALTCCCNADPACNPFGCSASAEEPSRDADLDALVANTSHLPLLEARRWPRHLLWLSAEAARLLDEAKTGWVERGPEACGVPLFIADTLFCHWPDAPLWNPRPEYPWDLPPAEPVEYRQRQLQQLVAAGCPDMPCLDADSRPVLLHVTHSWGGGVQRWVDDYCHCERDHIHLVLRSQGFWKRKTYGSRISLHLGGTEGPELDGWWLAPAIASTAAQHDQYLELLERVSTRYAVKGIAVSSLIGHSLDLFDLGLPVIQVVHDYYPAWPLLSLPAAGRPAAESLPEALANLAPERQEFSDRGAAGWLALAADWARKLHQAQAKLVAPSEAARRQLLALCPALGDCDQPVDVRIIEHGLRRWDAQPEPPAPAGADTSLHRLRLVLPGRLQEGKGLRLLLEAWPLLAPHVHLILLGCGRNGRALLGEAHIDVIMDYDWSSLPGLIRDLRPHAGLLLSTVSETFSYTLSELRLLGLPVIATNRGSFSERIGDRETGLLVEPEPEAILQAVQTLQHNPELYRHLRQQVASTHVQSMAAMLAEYRKLWPAPEAEHIQPPLREQTAPARQNLQAAQILNLDRLHGWQAEQLDRQQDRIREQTRELARRAAVMHRQRHEINRLGQTLQQHRAIIQDQTRQLKHQNARIRWQSQRLDMLHRDNLELAARLDEVTALRDRILASRSWKLTRPLRVGNRLQRNLRLHRVYDPGRWPLLFSALQRRIRTQGWLAALLHLQRPPLQDANTGRAAESAPSAIPSATPLHWKLEPESPANGHLILIARAAEPASVLPLLHALHEALQGQPAAVHMVTGKSPAASVWQDCAGLHCHPDLHTAVQQLSATLAAAKPASLLWIEQPIRMDATAAARLYLALDSGRELIAGRPLSGADDELAAQAGRPDPERARAREVHRYCPAAMLFAGGVAQDLVQCALDCEKPEQAATKFVRDRKQSAWLQPRACYTFLGEAPADIVIDTTEQQPTPAGRALIVDVWVPMADRDSGSLRMIGMLRLLLEAGWEVAFVPLNLGYADHYTDRLQSLGVEVWYQPWIGSWKRFLSAFGPGFDLVLLSRLNVARELMERVRRHCPGAKIIYDTVDLHFLREQRQAELQDSLPLKRQAEQTRHQELALMQQADMTLVVSAAEQDLLRRELPESRIRILSNIHAAIGSQRPFAGRNGVLFVGGYQHPPNLDAAIWLATAIWPQVRERLSGAELHLIGSNVTAAIRALDGGGIVVHGFVEHLEPWLDSVRLTVAPLRYGAGVKGKINSSMSRGVPVVATTIAAEGMFLTDGQDVLLADDAAAFAGAICRLHEDRGLWSQLSRNGLDNVREYFSEDRARADLQAALTELDLPFR